MMLPVLKILVCAFFSGVGFIPRSASWVEVPPDELPGRFVPSNVQIVSAATSSYHTLVLFSDGKVKCYGTNESGECSVPSDLANVVQIGAAPGYSVAVTTSGTLISWGHAPEFPAGLSVESVFCKYPGMEVKLRGGGFWVSPEGSFASKALSEIKSAETIVFGDRDYVMNHDGGVFEVNKEGDFKKLNLGFAATKIASSTKGLAAVSHKNGVCLIGQTGAPLPLFGAAVRDIGCDDFRVYLAESSGRISVWDKASRRLLWSRDQAGATSICCGKEGGMFITPHGIFPWGLDNAGSIQINLQNSKPVRLKAGRFGVVGLRENGFPVSWGRWTHDSYHLDSTNSCAFPLSTEGVRDVAQGVNITALVKKDGRLLIWGGGDADLFDVPKGLESVEEVALGNHFALARKTDGQVVAWGVAGNLNLRIPDGLRSVKQICAGGNHSIALTESGEVVQWGDELRAYAKLVVDYRKPKERVVKIAASDDHYLALTESGRVIAWGENRDGQCDVGAIEKVTDIAAGSSCSVCVSVGGKTTLTGNVLPNGAHEKFKTVVANGIVWGGLSLDGRVLLYPISKDEDPFYFTVPKGAFGPP